MLRQLWRDESGLTTVEYALVLMVIAAVAVTAWTLLGAATSSSASASSERMPTGD